MSLEEMVEDTIAIVETRNQISANGKFYKHSRNGISKRKDFSRKVYSKSDGVLSVPIELKDFSGNLVSGEVYIYYKVIGDVSKGMSIGRREGGKYVLRNSDIVNFIKPAIDEIVGLYIRGNPIERILSDKREYDSFKKEIISEISTPLLTKRIQPYKLTLMLNITKSKKSKGRASKSKKEVIYDTPKATQPTTSFTTPDFEINTLSKEDILGGIDYLAEDSYKNKKPKPSTILGNNKKRKKNKISLNLVDVDITPSYNKAPYDIKEKVDIILNQNEMYASNPTYWREVLTDVVSICVDRAKSDGMKKPLFDYITEDEFSSIKENIYKKMFLGEMR